MATTRVSGQVRGYIQHFVAFFVDQAIQSEQVVAAMTRTALLRDAPKTLRVDIGPEFISEMLDR